MKIQSRGFLVVPALLLAGVGCSYANTQLLLDKMNSSSSCKPPPRASAAERVERITYAAVSDAYFDQAKVGSWIDAAVANPAPIMALYHALQSPKPEVALQAFTTAVMPRVMRRGDGSFSSTTSQWNLPAPPVCLEPPRQSPSDDECTQLTAACETCKQAKAQCGGAPCECVPCTRVANECTATLPADACPGVEKAKGLATQWRLSLTRKDPSAVPSVVDAQRFVANLASIAPSLVTLHEIAFPTPTDEEVQAGLVAGLRHARGYLEARSWPRTSQRYRTALVLSGGAGTGAYEAGFVNRLLAVLERCRSLPGKCNGAAVDLVVGTSTGSLVGFLVDMFHVPGQETTARKLLRDEYTCSVENDLYCAVSAPINKVATTVPGLVKFDRIEGLLAKYWRPELGSNATELVTMSVDYESGALFADSDQDPADSRTKKGRVAAVLASIVEPLMAYPVRELYRGDETPIHGTFIDGGIRSGLPVMQAMRRGAERVLTISTSSIDPSPINRPEGAVDIVLRTIDLMVDQPRIAEAQQADLAASARRMAEYNLCINQFQVIWDKGTVLADQRELETFCRRTNLVQKVVGTEAAGAGWATPGAIEQVAKTWQSSWVYRSEKPIEGMSGYEFDPIGMRKLYLQGVDAFQARCKEILGLFSLPPDVVAYECDAKRDARGEEADAFLPEGPCQAKKQQPRRICESP